jgi:hypothetical protein
MDQFSTKIPERIFTKHTKTDICLSDQFHDSLSSSLAILSGLTGQRLSRKFFHCWVDMLVNKVLREDIPILPPDIPKATKSDLITSHFVATKKKCVAIVRISHDLEACRACIRMFLSRRLPICRERVLPKLWASA